MRRHRLLLAAFLFCMSFTMLSLLANAQTGEHGEQLHPQGEKAIVDSVEQYLLTSAASDFHTHGPSGPLRFRGVRFGHSSSPGAEMYYRLCGQFMRIQEGVSSQWTPFVTIKTSGYEQYVGDNANGYCQDSSIVWDGVGDLTTLLQNRFDASR